MGVWVHGCMGIGVYGYGCVGMGAWVYGPMGMGVWPYECVGAWVYGCVGAWAYGCMGVWSCGCVWVLGEGSAPSANILSCSPSQNIKQDIFNTQTDNIHMHTSTRTDAYIDR